MINLIASKNITNVTTLTTQNTNVSSLTPQFRALTWIMNYDKYSQDMFNEGEEQHYWLPLERFSEKMIERYTLAVLYFSTITKGYGSFSTTWWNTNKILGDHQWLTDEDVCYWGGIECVSIGTTITSNDNGVVQKQQGRVVTGINLWSVGLEGTIPNELGHLSSHLTKLWLEGSFLVGTIPTEIQLLSNLQYLALSSSSEEGNYYNQLFCDNDDDNSSSSSTEINHDTFPFLDTLRTDCAPEDNNDIICDCCTSCT